MQLGSEKLISLFLLASSNIFSCRDTHSQIYWMERSLSINTKETIHSAKKQGTLKLYTAFKMGFKGIKDHSRWKGKGSVTEELHCSLNTFKEDIKATANNGLLPGKHAYDCTAGLSTWLACSFTQRAFCSNTFCFSLPDCLLSRCTGLPPIA